MKLDSIVYDYGTLQTAISTALNSESTTFKAIYPSDTATSLTNVLASYGAMLQYQLVSAMANMYTDSAYSEAGIYQLAETLGNRLHGNISSQIYCDITRTNLKGINLVIPSGTKFTVADLAFFNPEPIVFALSTNTVYKVKLIQGVKLVSEQVTSGISGEKLYFCDDFKCNTDMVNVYVDGELWDITDSFLPYVVTDTSVSNKAQAVLLKTDPDGRTYIKFGNNTNGRIPDANSTVRIEYVSNEGANGNLNNNNLEINLSTPIYYTNTSNTREKLEVTINAISTASGGFNTQSLEVLKESSPHVFGSGQRAVRRNDYKAMLLNQCGYLTCNVWGEYEEAAIQGGYDKIMMNMVYYTGIKSIQKYDLQPVRSLEINIADIAATLYGITVETGNNAGWFVKELPEGTEPPLTINNITDDYTRGITFQSKAEAKAYLDEFKLTGDDAFDYGEAQEPSRLVVTWLDNPAKPVREVNMSYPVTGTIESARGFLGSYVIDIASYDIYNNTISVKYRDKQGTGILTCDPSINNSFYNEFETTVFPTNDLLTHASTDFVKITTNQKVDGKETLNEDLIINAEGKDFVSSGISSRTLQKSVITFNNPYQIRFAFNEAISVGAFAFKAPISENNYDLFMHKFAIYGLETTEPGIEPDYDNIKNNSSWHKLTGIQTFDNEIATGQYSDWITTSIYDPESTITQEEDITLTRTEKPVTYKTTLIDNYTCTLKVNGITIQNSRYTINKQGIITFTNTQYEPAPEDTVQIFGIAGAWKKYKYYVIEIYSIHDTAKRDPMQVALNQIKALFKESLSSIDYSNNNTVSLNIPLRITNEDKKVLCLPKAMEYYEYTVGLSNITTTNGYRVGDILKWSNIIDDIPYTIIATIININDEQPQRNIYNITMQTEEGIISSNLRGKSNLAILNDTLDADSSVTRGTGGLISISSSSTMQVQCSYTGNFYTNSDIQSADLPTLNKYNHFTTYIEFKQPLIKNVTIEANVEYMNVSNYQVVRNNVIAAINKLFELRPYSMGSSLNVSDVWKAINSVEGVKRFNVISPLNNIDTLPYELLMLPAENLIINDIINSEYK